MATIDSTYKGTLRSKSHFNDYADCELTVTMNPSSNSDTYVPVTGEVALRRADGADYYMDGTFLGDPITPASVTYDIYFMTSATGPKLLNMTTGAVDTLSNPNYASDEIKTAYRWKTVTVPYGATVEAMTKSEMNDFLHQLAVDTEAATEYEVNWSSGGRYYSEPNSPATWSSSAVGKVSMGYLSNKYNAYMVYISAKA